MPPCNALMETARHCRFVQAVVERHAPIASAAALIERPVQGHSNEEGTGAPRHHPDVSLRGAKRRGNLVQAVTISPDAPCDPAGYCEIATSAVGLLAMTNRRASRHRMRTAKVASLHGAR